MLGKKTEDEKAKKQMTAEKGKETEKGKNEEVFIERLLQERFNQWNEPFICPFCGKKDCKSFWHFLKLSTLPRSYLRPKHFFQLYGVFFIGIVVMLVIYITFEMLMRK